MFIHVAPSRKRRGFEKHGNPKSGQYQLRHDIVGCPSIHLTHAAIWLCAFIVSLHATLGHGFSLHASNSTAASVPRTPHIPKTTNFKCQTDSQQMSRIGQARMLSEDDPHINWFTIANLELPQLQDTRSSIHFILLQDSELVARLTRVKYP